MDKSLRTIPVVKDKSSKFLSRSSSTHIADVAAEVGVATESDAQSPASVEVGK
jgi:hypothetical protein